MLSLSPLNLSRLLTNNVSAFGRPPAQRLRAKLVWLCPHCEDIHTTETSAEECCLPLAQIHECPICESEAGSVHEEASCCLWKDFDMATRHRIADSVEAGSTWREAIEAASTKH